MSLRPYAVGGAGTLFGSIASWLLYPPPLSPHFAGLCSCDLGGFGWWDLIVELLGRLPRSIVVAAGSGFVAGFGSCLFLVGILSGAVWASCRRPQQSRYRCAAPEPQRDGPSRR